MKNFLMIFNVIVVFLALFGVWYSFSGFGNKFFLSLATISCIISVFFALRMSCINNERVPTYIRWKFPLYFLWLAKEVFVSAIQVTIKIWHPTPRISPTLGWHTSKQDTDLAKSIYGNSITLTPGTVCTDISDNNLQVHSLETKSLRELELGVMDKKVKESLG